MRALPAAGLALIGEGKPLEAWPMVPLVRLGLPPLPAARCAAALAVLFSLVPAHPASRSFATGRRFSLISRGRLAQGFDLSGVICAFAVVGQTLTLARCGSSR